MNFRKILLSLVTIASGIAICHLGMNSFSQPENDYASLLIQNVEALTFGDNPGPGKMRMHCNTEIMYTGAYSMPLHCRTCSFRYGYVPTGKSSTCP